PHAYTVSGQAAVSLARGGSVPIPDDAAFAASYYAEFKAFWLYLRRLGVAEADVEDAVHDVFVVAHRRYGTYDPSRPLRPWLLGIGFRIAAQWRRRHRLEVTVAEPEPERSDDARSPDEVVASREASRRLQAAPAPPPLRQPPVGV